MSTLRWVRSWPKKPSRHQVHLQLANTHTRIYMRKVRCVQWQMWAECNGHMPFIYICVSTVNTTLTKIKVIKYLVIHSFKALLYWFCEQHWIKDQSDHFALFWTLLCPRSIYWYFAFILFGPLRCTFLATAQKKEKEVQIETSQWSSSSYSIALHLSAQHRRGNRTQSCYHYARALCVLVH